MKRYLGLIFLMIFFFAENGFTEHRERGVIRQGQDICEYEIYFRDGYIGDQDALILVNMKAPLKAVHPVLEIRFTSTKMLSSDSVYTVCDLTENNRCLQEVWSGGVPYRGELRSFYGEHIVYPESLGKLGHFGDKRESTYRDQDWERGFIEIISSPDRVLARVPYFVRLLADRGFIAFGQAAHMEQRLYEQKAQQAPEGFPSSPPPTAPQVSTHERPRKQTDLSEFEFPYDFIYEYSIDSSSYPPVLTLIVKAREKIRNRSLWQPYGKDYLVFDEASIYGYTDPGYASRIRPYENECFAKYNQFEKCGNLNKNPNEKRQLAIKRLKIEGGYSIFTVKLLLESPIIKYLISEKGFKYSLIEPDKCTEKIKAEGSVYLYPKELEDWRDMLFKEAEKSMFKDDVAEFYMQSKLANTFYRKSNYFLCR